MRVEMLENWIKIARYFRRELDPGHS
jgi:hypothetical protein